MPDYRLGRLKGQFVVVWEEGGRRRRFRLGTRDPKAARATLREFVKERERLQRPETELTVAEIWAEYVAEKEAEGKISVGRMKDAWKSLSIHFAGLGHDAVTRGSIRDYVDSRRKKVGDGTIHTELGYLRAALRHAGVAATFKLPSKPRPRSRHLTPSEARRLIDACQMPHVRCYVMLALYTAGRPSSILSLTWDRVDFARRRINLDDPAHQRTAKGRAMVPLAEPLIGPLHEAKQAALTNYVIEWAGAPIRSVKKAIQRAVERGGLEGVTPYVLRHTAAVWMAEAGIPMSEIAQYLGHTSTAVTERTYARYSPEYLRRASDAISTVLSGAGEPNTVNTEGTKKDGKANAVDQESPER